MQLQLFDIQRGSYHDGPGLRTVIFLKGCNEHCFWCQNPESQSSKIEILYYAERCIGCGTCEAVCGEHAHMIENGVHIFDRKRCKGCAKCADVCCTEALQQSGWLREIDSIVEEVLVDVESFELSNGGITVSGGEPLLQIDGMEELLCKLHKKGIHTAIETAGNVPWTSFERILPYLNLIYTDLKHADSEMHQKYIGSGNGHILDNLSKLGASAVKTIVRTPVIPGINDSESDIHKIARIVKDSGIERLELLPFHKLGSGKYHALDRNYEAEKLETPSKERMQMLRKIIIELGMKTNDE